MNAHSPPHPVKGLKLLDDDTCVRLHILLTSVVSKVEFSRTLEVEFCQFFCWEV